MEISPRQHRAFTLLELMTVVAALLVLAALLVAAGAKGMDGMRRLKCANNIRQQLPALRTLASDHGDRYYWPAESLGDDSAPSHLYPEYIEDLRIFICPSTRNTIRDVKHPLTGTHPDLADNAHDRFVPNGGHSYEYYGYYLYLASVGRLQIKGPNFHGRVPPEWTVLVVDGDDQGENNFPERDNNHGEAGWNWGFADGHVEWVRREDTRDMLIKTATGRLPAGAVAP